MLNTLLPRKSILPLSALALMVASNYYWFNQTYFSALKKQYTPENNTELRIGYFIKENIPENAIFIAWGNNWSSSLAYFSQRKSFTVLTFYKQYQAMAVQPEKFIGNETLGAIVFCPENAKLPLNTLALWAMQHPTWHTTQINNCYVLHKIKHISS